MDEACRVAVAAVARFLKSHLLPKRVIFMLFSEDARKVYEACLEEME